MLTSRELRCHAFSEILGQVAVSVPRREVGHAVLPDDKEPSIPKRERKDRNSDLTHLPQRQ